MTAAPSVLVFDVNETLIDIESIAPVFERIFGDPAAMREWFNQLVLYSMTATLSGHYVDFFTLGQGILRMLATTRGVEIADADVDVLKHAMLTMPAHPDVQDGLTALRDNGFRLVTLTNSPPNPDGPSPLEHAGLGHLFRATAQRRELPSVQARAGGVLARVRAARRIPGGLHDGGRPRLGHHRRPVRRIQRRIDHPARQRGIAASGLAGADGRRDRSARFGGKTHKSGGPDVYPVDNISNEHRRSHVHRSHHDLDSSRRRRLTDRTADPGARRRRPDRSVLPRALDPTRQGDLRVAGRAERRPRIHEAIAQLREYFAGERQEFDLPINPLGSERARHVWQLLAEIPYGQTTTYGALADKVGSGVDARDIGGFVGANPLSIFVPCHRVVGSNGKLTGYAGGLDRKRYLLELENAIPAPPPALW